MCSKNIWEISSVISDNCHHSYKTVEDHVIKGSDITFDPDPRGLGFYIFQSMKHNKDKVAQYIADTGEEDSYAELLQRCVRTAINISLKGLTKPDIVCLCTSNHKNACVPYFASIFCGVTIACLDPALPLADIEYLLNLVKPNMIFIDENRVNLIERAIDNIRLETSIVVFGETRIHVPFDHYLRDVDGEEGFVPVAPDDLSDTAAIYFSSGTTSLPKGIMISHYGLIINSLILTQNCSVRDKSVLLCYSTLYWISAIIFSLPFIFKGRPRVISATFDAVKFCEIVQKYKVSLTFLSPSHASRIIGCGRPQNIDLSSLNYVLIGGGPATVKMMNELRNLVPGTWVAQGYGLTECGGVLTCFRLSVSKELRLLECKPLSCGRPVPGVHYKVVDLETEEPLGPNQKGELRIKSKAMTKGFHNMDASSEFDSEGFLKTGDLAYYDEDFCFYVIDRLKEMLKYRSWQIAPAKIENIILQLPVVKQVAVIGLPRPEDGDHIMALVVADEGATRVSEKDIEEYVNERVSDEQKLRGGVKFIKQLPVTPTGKIKRRELKQLVLSGEK